MTRSVARLVETPVNLYSTGMRTPVVTKGRGHPRASPAAPASEPWVKWTVQLPRTTSARLKVRAAQEGRTIRETLQAAVDTYCASALPETAVLR
jgi:hypothetical protein